jgi:hypothetical protein
VKLSHVDRHYAYFVVKMIRCKNYPNDFAYKMIKYIRDCDSDYEYICNDCVANNPQEVIKMLARADDIEIEHK